MTDRTPSGPLSLQDLRRTMLAPAAALGLGASAAIVLCVRLWSGAADGPTRAHEAALLLLVVAAFTAAAVLTVLRARRAARGLIAAKEAQSRFLADLSHEIRTPLNGVVAVASALERTSLSERQAELVRIIRSSGQTLERLLSDVLDFSKIETGAVVLEREPFHLADAVKAVGALCRPRAEEKGVALHVRIDAAAERLVLGDAVRFKQILTNLVSNAVKFTEQGEVVLRLQQVRGEAWRIEVQDTGVGFDPAQKARLFRRFQQADGAVSRRFGGTGLGLAISRQLVELMGGALDCDSRPGEGSIFTVDLPLTPAALPAAQASSAGTTASLAEPVLSQGRRLRVLLADDHPVNRTVVEVLLADVDLDLVSVENGLEACQAFEDDRFDVVLMDMQMPELDGVEAVRRIRAHERRAGADQALIVMLTANALREHQEQSLAAGADLHLPKPIEAARLFAALEAGQARALDAAGLALAAG